MLLVLYRHEELDRKVREKEACIKAAKEVSAEIHVHLTSILQVIKSYCHLQVAQYIMYAALRVCTSWYMDVGS